jgi:hypothetical protein
MALLHLMWCWASSGWSTDTAEHHQPFHPL